MAYQSNYDTDDEAVVANEKQPFYTADWLEDCYQQLAVPNPNIEKLMEKIAERLAVNVKGQLDNSGKQQALFTLLGRQYVKQHFPHHKYDPTMLEPPKMKSDTKVILLEDMREWLQQQLVATCHELGYDKSAAEGLKHAELGPFYRQAEGIYKKQLDKRVQEIKTAKAKSRGSAISASKLGIDLDSPSHALGEALLAIGLRDPFKMARILKKMQQRCLPLPMSLRSYVWSDFLFLRDGVKVNIVLTNVVKQRLQKFETAVNQHTKEMKLSRSTESPMNKQIDTAVMDAYNHHPSLKSLDADAHLLEAVHVLNMLYVYNRSFNPIYVFWLCPLQISIERDTLSEVEGRLHLALHLDMFVRHCSLSSSELFTCAQQVMDTLKSLDPYLHEHLGDMTAKSVYVNPKDFPEECLHQDKAEAEKIATELGMFSGSDVPESRLPVFSDPAIFLRKWLLTGLASVLSPPALLLMWDFFFLGKWDRRRLHDICLVLLGLLKPWFYRAKDYTGIKQVFFEEPSMLYTSDLRKALTHWQDRGAFDDIPNMNHNIINKSATTEGKKS